MDENKSDQEVKWPFVFMICFVVLCVVVCCLGSFWLAITPPN